MQRTIPKTPRVFIAATGVFILLVAQWRTHSQTFGIRMESPRRRVWHALLLCGLLLVLGGPEAAGQAGDYRRPTIQITQPTTSTSYSTTTPSITIGGTAQDRVGVTRVTWATDRGQSGVAQLETTTWSFPLALLAGTTTVTVSAFDAAGNQRQDSLTVILLTPPPPGPDSCPSGQVGTPPNCFPAPPAPAASGKQWKVIFSEEFNGTTLDTTKLTPCFDWNYGACTASFNTGKERYLPSQVQISNGTAKLVAEPLAPPYANSACYQGQCTYKAGLVSTARPRADNGSAYLFSFTYGYVEARVKFPGMPGFFTAFWMLPTAPSFSYDTEIDIVEILGGYPDTIFMTYHYNGRGTSYTPNNGLHNNGACPVKDYSTDFVRFGVDWEPTSIAWYIDGVKCGQFNGTTTTIENGPMQLILHMMVDNQWERDWGSVLPNQTLVRQLEVDYIRIYQQQ